MKTDAWFREQWRAHEYEYYELEAYVASLCHDHETISSDDPDVRGFEILSRLKDRAERPVVPRVGPITRLRQHLRRKHQLKDLRRVKTVIYRRGIEYQFRSELARIDRLIEAFETTLNG